MTDTTKNPTQDSYDERAKRLSERRQLPPKGTNAINFPKRLAPDRAWLLTAIPPDGSTETRSFDGAEAARKFIATRNSRGDNVYYSINPTKAALQSKAKKTDIASVEYLHVDADPADDESPDDFKRRLRSKISAFPRQPSFVIDSGNGIQLLWRLRKPVKLTDADAIADIEARNHGLALAFGADASTRNIDRIFRLPGTANFPNRAKRRRGRVQCRAKLLASRDIVYPLSAFAPHRAASEPTTTRSDTSSSELPAKLRTLLLVEGKGGYPSRHELVFAFLTGAIRAGLADDKIIAALLDRSYAGKGIYQHIKEQGGRRCAERQLQRAHDTVGSYQGAEHSEQRRLIHRSLDQFERRELEWLWFPFAPLGMITVIIGDKAIGKSSVTLDMAARISTGLEPVKRAIGPWNFDEVSPQQMLGRFTGFLKSVILRISEARDLGEFDRFKFYDHSKAYITAPPDVLRIDEKHIREYSIPNVCGIIITTNHKTDGIYLPADDRRHYVAWSELSKDDFEPNYWTDLWRWYEAGGYGHVAAYLAGLDLTGFDPKAPPPKTQAFWEIVDASRSPEDAGNAGRDRLPRRPQS